MQLKSFISFILFYFLFINNSFSESVSLVCETEVIADREKKIVDHFLLSCGKLTNEDKYIFNKHSFSISPNN